ncbi:MAG TPA: hypothetical protein VJG30_04390 [Candidatus Nanoarchaeia archaeon]|nr:hypothetical protein [Candidatus Nanoarchaeia archaeon]
MILGYETIINKIIEATSLPRNEIESKVEQKLKDLHDLISREGAAHIVANELSVKLFDNVNRTLKIKDLAPGLSSVNIIARVLNIYETKSFNTGKRSGRVGSFLIGDETGTARVVVWDDRLIDETKTLQEGNIIKISNAYSKLNNNNYSELHLGNKAQVVINPVNETVGEVRINMLSKKKNIKDLQPNEFVEVFGTIVEVFEPKFYQACPVCNKKVIFSNDSFSCQEHNQVTPKQVPIVNLILDDATDNIRVVCFRDVAEKIIGKDKPDFEIVKKDNKGRQIMVKGKVSKNEMFSRVELIASAVEELDPARIIQELELKQ